jgi:hypothetical protein
MLFLGTCVNVEHIWDATELAQLVENSELFEGPGELLFCLPEELRQDVLLDFTNRFIFGRNDDIVWFHDDETDIHYFYQS